MIVKTVIICFVSALIFNFVECSEETLYSKIEVVSVHNLTEFLKGNSSFRVIHPLVEEQSKIGRKFAHTYTFGRRIRGDQLVAAEANRQIYSFPTNVELRLQYPRSGVGRVVTYAQIHVEQSTLLGRADIIAGGIDQRFIYLIVESYGTVYFNYTAHFYGY